MRLELTTEREASDTERWTTEKRRSKQRLHARRRRKQKGSEEEDRYATYILEFEHAKLAELIERLVRDLHLKGARVSATRSTAQACVP